MITTKYGNFESQEEYIAHLESLITQEQERADRAFDESQKAHDKHQAILEKLAKLRAFFEEVDNLEGYSENVNGCNSVLALLNSRMLNDSQITELLNYP